MMCLFKAPAEMVERKSNAVCNAYTWPQKCIIQITAESFPCVLDFDFFPLYSLIPVGYRQKNPSISAVFCLFSSFFIYFVHDKFPQFGEHKLFTVNEMLILNAGEFEWAENKAIGRCFKRVQFSKIEPSGWVMIGQLSRIRMCSCCVKLRTVLNITSSNTTSSSNSSNSTTISNNNNQKSEWTEMEVHVELCLERESEMKK